jgi:hypothetical protein
MKPLIEMITSQGAESQAILQSMQRQQQDHQEEQRKDQEEQRQREARLDLITQLNQKELQLVEERSNHNSVVYNNAINITNPVVVAALGPIIEAGNKRIAKLEEALEELKHEHGRRTPASSNLTRRRVQGEEEEEHETSPLAQRGLAFTHASADANNV